MQTQNTIIFSLEETPNTSMIYYTGYKGLGIYIKETDTLIVPVMEYEKAKKYAKTVIKTNTLLETLKQHTNQTIGIEENKITVSFYKQLKKLKFKIIDVSNDIITQKITKSKDEIAKIKTACKYTDEVLQEVKDNFTFKTEKELKFYMENSIRKKGLELAFPAIVASNKGSSLPHYESKGKITKGFLLLDFGAKYNGYCADMTRMLYIGKPTKEELENNNLLLNVVKKCESLATKTKLFKDLDIHARKLLGTKEQYFIHSLGHGLGLDIHEMPSVNNKSTYEIKENIPFTIEPGIYFPGKYGIRIEDTCVILNGKLEVLTKSSKELHIVKQK